MRINLKKIIFFLILLTTTLFLSIDIFAVPMKPGYEKLNAVISFLNLLINVMRWGSASVGGVVATVLGWQMIMNMNTDASSIAKKGLKNIAWGMFFIFCGSFIVDFFVSKFFSIIGG